MKKSLKLNLNTVLIELKEKTKILVDLRIRYMQMIKNMVGEETIKLDEDQPYVHLEEGAFATTRVNKTSCKGKNNDGQVLEYDLADQSADDLGAIAWAVYNVINK